MHLKENSIYLSKKEVGNGLNHRSFFVAYEFYTRAEMKHSCVHYPTSMLTT